MSADRAHFACFLHFKECDLLLKHEKLKYQANIKVWGKNTTPMLNCQASVFECMEMYVHV